MFRSILEYVYLGSVNIDSQDMEEFQRVMKDLQIHDVFENYNTEDNMKSYSSNAKSEFDARKYDLPKTIIIKEHTTKSEDKYEPKEGVNDIECKNEDSQLVSEDFVKDEEMDKASDANKQDVLLSNVVSKESKRYKSKYSCETCDFETNLSSRLSKHQLFKHGERTFLCHICDMKFFNGCHLKSHIEALHEETKDCSICNFKASTKRNLDRHISKKHFNQTPIQCAECSYTTTENANMKLHVSRLHTAKETWPKCTECDYRSWNKSTLKDHYLKEHEGLRLKCEVCPAKFTKKCNLHAHMKKIHKDILKETTQSVPTNAPFSERYYFDNKYIQK